MKKIKRRRLDRRFYIDKFQRNLQMVEEQWGKMASVMLKNVRVPANSANLEEARSRTFDFFKMVCRSIPKIMDIYNLDDVVTVSQLRSIIASEFRKNSHVTNTKVLPLCFSCPFSPLKRRRFFWYVIWLQACPVWLFWKGGKNGKS